jgi:2,4-dienoyl-CoA reductase (NADPH2)
MNAFLGHEGEWKIEKTKKPKYVIVAGAGPAGLEAARVAALCGHRVEVYDKNREPGGLVPMATFIKGGDTIDKLHEIVTYYNGVLKDLNVPVYLKKEVNEALIREKKPDAVILGVGGLHVKPDIPGVEHDIVMTTDDLREQSSGYVDFFGPGVMQTLSKVYLPIGKNVVIIGGQMAGLQAAEFLVKRGRKVDIIDKEQQLGGGIPIPWLVRLMPWLQSKAAGLYDGVHDIVISEDGVQFSNAEGKHLKIKADQVLLVTDNQPNRELY